MSINLATVEYSRRLFRISVSFQPIDKTEVLPLLLELLNHLSLSCRYSSGCVIEPFPSGNLSQRLCSICLGCQSVSQQDVSQKAVAQLPQFSGSLIALRRRQHIHAFFVCQLA